MVHVHVLVIGRYFYSFFHISRKNVKEINTGTVLVVIQYGMTVIRYQLLFVRLYVRVFHEEFLGTSSKPGNMALLTTNYCFKALTYPGRVYK